MKLHHTLLALAAAVVLVGGGAAVAFASPQAPTTGPDSAACVEAQAAVQLRADAAAQAAVALAAIELPDAVLQDAIDTAAAEVAEARGLLDAALGILDEFPTLGNALAADTAGDNLTEAVEALLAVQGPAGDLLNTARRTLAEARVALQAALDVQVEACAESETEPTTEPTTEPEPSETPAPPPADDDAVGDLDCIDFPLDDGRTAQDVLDEDSADPHMLDYDEDDVACELDDNTSGEYTQVDALPVAIDTGRA